MLVDEDRLLGPSMACTPSAEVSADEQGNPRMMRCLASL
jgi:hypothetical protein